MGRVPIIRSVTTRGNAVRSPPAEVDPGGYFFWGAWRGGAACRRVSFRSTVNGCLTSTTLVCAGSPGVPVSQAALLLTGG